MNKLNVIVFGHTLNSTWDFCRLAKLHSIDAEGKPIPPKVCSSSDEQKLADQLRGINNCVLYLLVSPSYELMELINNINNNQAAGRVFVIKVHSYGMITRT